MTTSVNNNGALPTISSLPDISAGGSIQFQFAKLQLVMSQQAKTQAENYMKQIEDIQKEQSETAKMIEYKFPRIQNSTTRIFGSNGEKSRKLRRFLPVFVYVPS